MDGPIAPTEAPSGPAAGWRDLPTPPPDEPPTEPPDGPPAPLLGTAGASRHPPSRRLVAIGALSCMALGIGGGFVGGLLADRGEDAPTATASSTVSTGAATGALLSQPTASSTASSSSSLSSSSAIDAGAVLAALQSSVVSVDATVVTGNGRFQAPGEAAGTGIVLDDAGHIITNAHVVEGATSVTVTLDGQDTPRTATVVASDTAADVAVLQVSDTSGLVPATFGSLAEVTVGEPVVAIGNALALEGGLTVTEGIVSALDRSLDTDTTSYDHLIQTDAAISSGNSGGPLVDAQGRVIGMNTAAASSGGSVQASNIGFAIDVDTALAVAHQLLGV
jgi:S1-C subfamily serine protease